MKKTRMLCAICLSTTLTACANSASHKVVSTEKSTDAYLSCSDIRVEKRKTQAIIDGVDRDKEDMTGADFVDGLLWFPFNVIAKQSNYSSATNAAESRISHLTAMEAERGCSVAGNNSVSDTKVSQQLKSLNQLYKEGLLTESEFFEKREAVLNQITDTSKPYSNSGKSEVNVGQYSFKVAKMAETDGCLVNTPAEEIIKDGYVMYYQVGCSNKPPVVYRCEFNDCSPSS